MPRQTNSVFTPAMGPRGPGYTVGVPKSDFGAYLSGFAMPSWAGYAAVAGFLGLAAFGKIRWPIALMGAGAAWWFLIPPATQLVSGVGILTSGATVPLNQAALSADNSGNQFITQGGVTYPVLSVQNNPQGGMTYFLDNPTSG